MQLGSLFLSVRTRNGSNGPADSAGRCSFLCPVCLRKLLLALSFVDSVNVVGRYHVAWWQ